MEIEPINRRLVITGCAGLIGSKLFSVINQDCQSETEGVDHFSHYYD